MSLSAALWKENQALAVASLNNPFVEGIKDGSLPKGKFAYYVSQDAFFLKAFARAYIIAGAKAAETSSQTERACCSSASGTRLVIIFKNLSASCSSSSMESRLTLPMETGSNLEIPDTRDPRTARGSFVYQRCTLLPM